MAQTLPSEVTKTPVLAQLPSFVEEAPEFHDPFSDINLFLAQRLQHSLKEAGFPKKWTSKLEDRLFKEIAPEFKSRFPKYRLSICALKKAWERIYFYISAIREEKRALTQEGKVDIFFLIRENLRRFPPSQGIGLLRPYHYAYELALKIGECIASIDAVRPNIEELARLIWAVAKNLIPADPSQLRSPYDEDEPLDRFLMKTVAFQLVNCPTKGAAELEAAVHETIALLNELPTSATGPMLRTTISALLAERLIPETQLRMIFSPAAYDAMQRLSEKILHLSRAAHPNATPAESVRRCTALLQLASQLPKGISADLLKEAILKSYPTPQEGRPDLPQSLYAFIAALGVLMQTEEYCHSAAFVVETISRALQDAELLTGMKGKEEELELFIWKLFAKEEKLLDSLPYRLGARIEEEIALSRIMNPHLSFASLAERVVQIFTRAKMAGRTRRETLERKIKSAVLQGEMVFRWLPQDEETPLFKLVLEKWKDPSESFISELVQHYLQLYPHLAPYTPQIAIGLRMAIKTHLFAEKERSALNIFLKIKLKEMRTQLPHLSQEELYVRLEEETARLVPLLPFDGDTALALMEDEE